MKILTFFYLDLSEFKQSYLPNPVRYFIQIFRIFYTYCLLSHKRSSKAEIKKIPKFAFSGVGLLFLCVYACANCMQNIRFQLIPVTDAKYLLCYNTMFQKSFRNIQR